MNDLDHLLAGVERAAYLGAHRPRPHPRQKIPHDGEVHVGFQQGQADLTQRGINIGFIQLATPCKVLKYGLKFVA